MRQPIVRVISKPLLAMSVAFLLVAGAASRANAAVLLVENFDDVSLLAGGGWAAVNNSDPIGTTGWFQGNTGVFASQAGAADAYIAANFENAALGGDISNWLLTPELALDNGTTINFYSRTEEGAPFPDRLELRLSVNGASTNVGVTDASVGDFATLLLTLNPGLLVGGYPESWTLFSATLSGLGAPTSGRFGFRYFVTDTSINGDYIGIDTLSVESAVSTAVPEPVTMLTMGIGLLGIHRARRRRNV